MGAITEIEQFVTLTTYNKDLDTLQTSLDSFNITFQLDKENKFQIKDFVLIKSLISVSLNKFKTPTK